MNTKTKERIDQLLSTEMDRAGFLKACGVAILALVGVSGIAKALAGAQTKQQPAPAAKASSPGDRAFGE